MTKAKEIVKALPTLKAVIVFETIEGLDDSITSEHLPAQCKAIRYKELATQDTFTPYVSKGFFKHTRHPC